MSDARLYLLTPVLSADALDAFVPRFAAALGAGDVASVLARMQPGADARRIVGALMEIAARCDAALLIEDDARLAARLGADGVHVGLDEVAEAVGQAKGQRIVGAGRLTMRDDAMTAGEAGADYVMFGEPGATLPPDNLRERVAWWAEIFQTPCVAYAAALADVAPLALAGADFVALADAIWSADDCAEAVRQAMRDVGRQT